MILSDVSIKMAIAVGDIVVHPLDPNDIQPASIDVHLDKTLKIPDYYVGDTHENGVAVPYEMIDRFVLAPRDFVLGSTIEHIEIPNYLVAVLESTSSLKRLGLFSAPGFVDPGWKGQLTLEISNLSRNPLRLYPGMKIGQLVFFELTTPAARPYGTPSLHSKYQNQVGATPWKA